MVMIQKKKKKKKKNTTIVPYDDFSVEHTFEKKMKTFAARYDSP